MLDCDGALRYSEFMSLVLYVYGCVDYEVFIPHIWSFLYAFPELKFKYIIFPRLCETNSRYDQNYMYICIVRLCAAL